MKAALLLIGALALTGCATLPGVCPAGHDQRQKIELYFGRNIGHDLGVSERDFEAFIEKEVSPRFPDGLTITDAQGRWQGQDRTIIHEPSKVVTLIAANSAETQTKVDAIRAAYKARFEQEAVMEVSGPACVGF